MISRRHMHLVIALLLPLMVMRAMLPTGFMPVAENGSFRIAWCRDGLAPGAPERSSDPAPDNGDHQQPSDGGHCTFANAALNGPPPTTFLSIVTIDVDAGAALAHAAPARVVSLVRVQSARGPPSLYL